MKAVNFVILIGSSDRIRHYHESVKGIIENFVLQYETLVQKKWMAVVRYDTAHGFAHQDRMHPDGSSEKIVLGITNYNRALTLAEKDIKNNWRSYKIQFLRELENG